LDGIKEKKRDTENGEKTKLVTLSGGKGEEARKRPFSLTR